MSLLYKNRKDNQAEGVTYEADVAVNASDVVVKESSELLLEYIAKLEEKVVDCRNPESASALRTTIHELKTGKIPFTKKLFRQTIVETSISSELTRIIEIGQYLSSVIFNRPTDSELKSQDIQSLITEFKSFDEEKFQSWVKQQNEAARFVNAVDYDLLKKLSA